MEYLIQLSSILTLVLDSESIRFATIINTGMEYLDLTVVLATALLASVVVDQLYLLRGKFKNKKSALETLEIQQKLMQVFLRHQFLSGITQRGAYLSGAEEIGHLRFFLYNLVSSCIWFTVLVMVGAVLRMIWIGIIGHFGPFEFELIAGILAAYALFLMFMFFTSKKANV